jgi:hypothetical protein
MITTPLTLKLAAFAVAGATAGGAVLALAPSQAADQSGSQTKVQSAAQSDGQSASRARHPGRLQAGRFLARHVIHAQWTTANGDDHAAIRGTVTAVSAHALVIRAKDGTSQTWQVDDSTKVRVLGDDHRGLDKFSSVLVGDQALAAGTAGHDAKRLFARAPKGGANPPATSSS